MATDARPLRKTTHGEILGYYMESSGTLAEVYEAVPYAEPPIGSLRFEVVWQDNKAKKLLKRMRNYIALNSKTPGFPI